MVRSPGWRGGRNDGAADGVVSRQKWRSERTLTFEAKRRLCGHGSSGDLQRSRCSWFGLRVLLQSSPLPGCSIRKPFRVCSSVCSDLNTDELNSSKLKRKHSNLLEGLLERLFFNSVSTEFSSFAEIINRNK